ncbi:MAG: leucyl aminopeptidase [Patescibacteria group bacterium]
MRISLSKTTNPSSSFVFLLADGAILSHHTLHRELTVEEQGHIKAFEYHTHLSGEYAHVIFLPTGRKALLFGIGAKPSHRKLLRTLRAAMQTARTEKIKSLTFSFDDFLAGDHPSTPRLLNHAALAETLATQAEMTNFEFTQYKTPPKEGWFSVEEVTFLSRGPKLHPQEISRAIERGKIIGEEANACRALANIPGGDMTPLKLFHAAQDAGTRCGFSVNALDEKAMGKLRMGGILGVSKGSQEKPRFIIMEHLKGKMGEKPVVLIGKGVTFDTGGLNLKPGDSMSEMHMDMSGGAAVIHTIAALARLKVKKNIIGLVPAVENMPSGSSYHPGDILRTMSGKTIEVLNTDAEGRIILADALEYSKKYNPSLVIDIATLTGASLSALGQRASAMFSTSVEIARKLQDTGEMVSDFVWPLPLWEEYEQEIQGTFGDVANLGKTRYGGAITGAVFLWQFIKESTDPKKQPPHWVHLDIAPRMTTIEGDFLAKGAAGAPVALLATFLRQ